MISGRWQSGQSQQTVNLPPTGYGGSNPPLPTNLSPVRVRAASQGWWRCLFGGKPRFARRRGEVAEMASALVGSGVGRKSGGLAPPKRSARGVDERASEREGGSNSVVESQPSKLLVAGSIPVSRSNLRSRACGRELRLASRVGLSAVARSAKADWQACHCE